MQLLTGACRTQAIHLATGLAQVWATQVIDVPAESDSVTRYEVLHITYVIRRRLHPWHDSNVCCVRPLAVFSPLFANIAA